MSASGLPASVHRPDAAQTAWHELDGDEVLRRLDSRASGLSEAEAAGRLETHGPNRLPEPTASPPLLVFLRQFRSPLIYILLAASLVSLALGAWSDAIFIFIVLVLNSVIGATQEWRAESGAAALKRIMRLHPAVMRDGVRRTIDGADLAPGDIVLLESGAAVPADLRLLNAQTLRIDESLLTGESAAISKSTEPLPASALLADRTNMAFAGTMVVAGRATGVVCATGLHTQLGAVAHAMRGADAAPPLVLRMRSLSRRIAVAIVVLVLLLALGQLARGTPLPEIFAMSVALAVSAMPEGLPVAVTMALAVASSRMARRRVIVRRLPAVEGLGSCTLIASDKTGTLTANRLTLQRIVLPTGETFDIAGEGLDVSGELSPTPGAEAIQAIQALAAAGALANEARLSDHDGVLEVSGDTVDTAFLVFAAKLGLRREALLAHQPEASMLPYEPLFAFSASLNAGQISVKGAPERVLAMCGEFDRDAAEAQVRCLAEQGYRVIALAAGEATDHGDLRGRHLCGLRLLGFAGLIDPVRREVPDAVARCRAAGVEVRMITGDHPQTALAIARRIHPDGDVDNVMTGAELTSLSGEALHRRILEADVYARVEPRQKTQIVEALQAHGHFVAVTGDGVNDAPALRTAHVGVAMGASGTDAARAAAELILTDDNFASIVAGIEEGRTAYANIRKIVWLLISTAVAEVLLFSLALMTGLPMPLTPVQILWLNLVHEGIQDVALALEGKEPGVMERPPRSPREAIFDRRMIEQCVVTGVYIGVVSFLLFGWLIGEGGYGLEAARNAVLLFLVLFDNVHVLNCRSETRSAFRIPLRANPVLIATLIGAPSIHVLAMYTPGLREVLDLHPVGLAEWMGLGALALTVLVVGEAYKTLRPDAAWPRASRVQAQAPG